MRKHILLPALTLLAGGVGFGLRKWQLASGFEPGAGLPIPNAPAALALMGWSALVAAAMILLCLRYQDPTDLAALDARDNVLFLTAAVLSAFLLLASAAADAMAYPDLKQAAGESASALPAALPALRLALCAGGFLCALLWARQLFREVEKARQSLPLLELCLLGCVWLISDYQVRAAEPVTTNFVYEVLAIVCTLMGLYYLAGYSFQAGKPRRTMVLCLLGVYFSLVTLADGHSLADVCRYAFAILFLGSHSALLLRAAEEAPAVTNDEREETDHE